MSGQRQEHQTHVQMDEYQALLQLTTGHRVKQQSTTQEHTTRLATAANIILKSRHIPYTRSSKLKKKYKLCKHENK